MKNTSKILAVLMLVALMVAMLATYSFAAIGMDPVKTGQGMKFSDYGNVNFIVHDSYESGDDKTGASKGAGQSAGVSGAVTIKTDGKGAPYIYDTNSSSSSKAYVKVDFTKNTEGTLYLEPSYKTLDKAKDDPAATPLGGYVMEFDICSQATTNNDWSCYIQALNTHEASKGLIDIFSFQANNGKAKVEAKDIVSGEEKRRSFTAASEGGWIHITILYNPAEAVLTVYANDAKVDRAGTVSRTCIAQVSNKKDTISVYPMCLRMGRQQQTTGDFCIDNVLYYQSTKVCDPQYMDKITPAESFIGNVSVAKDDKLSSPQRYAAYEKVKSEYINTYWTGTACTAAANTPELQQAVTDFNGINAESLKSLAMNYNANEFVKKVNALKAMKRGFSNLEDRATQISAIETFMTSTATLINKDNANYPTAIGDLDTYKLYYQDDINIRAFINRMNRFGTATTAAAMQRHYDEATEFYPAASAVESKIGSTDKSTYEDATERENIRNAISAYKNADTKLAAKVKEYNAQKFINLVNFFKDTTMTEWEADDGTIRNQWYLARGILLENNYKEDSAFSSAKTGIYDPVNAYFSAKMQAEHVAVLQAKLAVFEAEGANYVDKAGVCKYIDNYLERNAADIVTDADINAIKAKNAEYKTLLASLEIDYTEKLVENTAEFVSQMEHIATVKDYKDLKPLFDEATVNYYNMNLIGNEGAGLDTVTVQNAVSAYEALKTRLLNNEVYGARFVAQMADLPSEKSKDDYYAAFMNCYGCEEYLDTTYEGVADCKGRYDTMKANYLAKVDLANTESASTLDSVCSVRTFCGIGDLINHVQKTLFADR